MPLKKKGRELKKALRNTGLDGQTVNPCEQAVEIEGFGTDW